MVSAYDFLPTLLEYLDLPIPQEQNLPGESFLPQLLGESGGRDHVVIYDEYGATRMVRTADWKYIHRYPDGPNELYDLKNDPDERSNLIEEEGERSRVAEMKEMLETWFDRFVRPEKDGKDRGVSGGGQLRPVGNGWEDGNSPFAEHYKP
jgi:arylsulfatase A-like enzyme